jgi:2,3-bisphosphoglycerate-dependent phosphoglycerate mutase
MVVNRVRSLWVNEISAALRSVKRVVITAHGNSLRALLKLIIGMSDDEIAALEVVNAVPMTVDFDDALTVIGHSVKLESRSGACK